MRDALSSLGIKKKDTSQQQQSPQQRKGSPEETIQHDAIIGRTPRDRQTFLIALIVISGFMFIFSLVIFFRDLDTVKTVSSIWAAWVGAVIGYFFGTKPVDALTQRTEALAKLTEKRANELESVRNSYTEKLIEVERKSAELEKTRAEVERKSAELEKKSAEVEKTRAELVEKALKADKAIAAAKDTIESLRVKRHKG